jgi:integrase
MASVFKANGATKYTILYYDENGDRRKKAGYTDKRASQELATKLETEARKIRDGLGDRKDIAYRDHGKRPLSEHVADWRQDMINCGKTLKHADQYRDRAGKVIALARGASIDELESGRSVAALARTTELVSSFLGCTRFADLTSEAIQAALATLSDCGKSNQTVNHCRAAVRAFLRWSFKKKRIREVPMQGVESFNVEEDQRVRRALTDDELGRLIRATEVGPIRFEMTGPLRAMAYRVASATGFRVQELRSLTPESFRINRADPTIFLRASSTKNRRPADQPISQALARDLRDWLKDKPKGQTVFPLHHETAKAIRADLEAIGVTYETDAGTADFHSLRAYYVSALIRSGASVSELQKLARHAKPETTLKHYAKLAPNDLRGAVESLPVPFIDKQPETLAATGTDPRAVLKPTATENAPYEDESARLLSFPDISNERKLNGCNAITERGGFEPPKPVSQFNGLANRRYRPLSHLSCSGRPRVRNPR